MAAIIATKFRIKLYLKHFTNLIETIATSNCDVVSLLQKKWAYFNLILIRLVKKDMDVNEHERRSKFTFQHKLKLRNSTLLLFYISQSQQGHQ